MRKPVIAMGAGLMALSIFLAACSGQQATTKTPAAPEPAKDQPKVEAKADPETKELVIYSGRKEELIKPVLEAFEKQTGVKVVVKAAGATELATLVLEEKSNPKSDIYLSNDAGAMEKLRMEKVLEAYTSDKLKAVPEDLKAPDNTWYAITVRARAIMYNKALVKESELPAKLTDLADAKWKNQIGMATGANESVIAQVTTLRLTMGDQGTEKFLNDLKANGLKVYKGHGDVRQAVGKGEIKLGWVNHYYYHLQTKEKENNNVGLVYPDQDATGTAVNVSGGAIVKGAKNMANAKKFMDFLLTPEIQKLFAEVNYEMPVLPGVATADSVKKLADIKRAPVKFGQFGTEWDKSVQLIDKLGLVLK